MNLEKLYIVYRYSFHWYGLSSHKWYSYNELLV